MQQFEQQNGYRLLDYLDVHGYITPPGVGFDNTISSANTALRLTSTRAFWDPTYIVPGFTNCSGYSDANGNQVAPALIPTMHGWVNTNYPNTKLAITEYNWGALEDITGAVAQADILGIFGREQLDMATLWPDGSFTLGVPGSYAFQIFLNYDGNGQPVRRNQCLRHYGQCGRALHLRRAAPRFCAHRAGAEQDRLRYHR